MREMLHAKEEGVCFFGKQVYKYYETIVCFTRWLSSSTITRVFVKTKKKKNSLVYWELAIQINNGKKIDNIELNA